MRPAGVTPCGGAVGVVSCGDEEVPVVTRTFPFRFDRVAFPLRAMGITPRTARVDVTDTHLDARFGPWRCRTPLSNVKDVRITRDYTAAKAIGPRGSFADLGATFGTSTVGGVCVCFHERVAALTPVPVHPGITFTVVDLEGFAAHLRDRCGLTTGDDAPG